MNTSKFNEEVFSQISEDLKNEVKQTLSKTGLDWDVVQEELVSVTGLKTPNSATFRSDSNSWLGTMSKKYKPLQNSELVLTLIAAASKFNLKISSGGVNYDGKRVYLNLNLEDKYVGDSRIKRFISVVNYHNGLGSVNFGSYYKIEEMGPNGEVINKNFFKLNSEAGRFRHSSNLNEKIAVTIENLFASIKEDEGVIETFNKMAEIKVNDEMLKEIIFKCYGIDPGDPTQTLSTRALNKFKQVDTILKNEVQKNQASAWGLFNGVLSSTEILTPKNSQTKDFYMAGNGYNINLKAYDIISNYLK
jgi:hypothetical protein